MNEWMLYLLVFVIVLFALIATIVVGVSAKNKEGNPTYDQRTGKNLLRLTWIYAVVLFGGYLVFAIYMYYM